MSQSEKDRLAALENRLAILEGQMATGETPGLVRLSSSSAVTDSTGLALAASEKNAALDGTLASQISESKENISKLLASAVMTYTCSKDLIFDFDSPWTKTGIYRLGASESYINPPTNTVDYGNVFVSRINDTIGVMVFPYVENAILFRTGNYVNFTSHKWMRISAQPV